MTTIHLLPNAHLDPVWLWDWREGLNEGIATCRAVLDLMDEFPELTFMRGEAAIYRHIEDSDPQTFARIQAHIEGGRWDVVGGVWVQPDTNLPATSTLLRQFQTGNAYFESRFGARPRIGWAADSFGHSAGLPEILAASGMEGIAFTRPFDAPHAGAFWWQGSGGSRVLAYRPPAGWYGCERDEMPRRLDELLEAAAARSDRHVAAFLGLGNHGGGPSRRHLEDIARWRQAHPEIQVLYSTLHGFFDKIRGTLKAQGEAAPLHRGELNFCLRGCYSSAAKVKYSYRRAEALVQSAEVACSAIGAALQTPAPDLSAAWEGVLFNSFHDILPGTSIERALDEQIEWLGGAIHEARKARFAMLNALAQRVDTSVSPVEGDFPTAVPFLVWNPHPHEYSGMVELEACLDARPLADYYGKIEEVPIEVRGADGGVLPLQTLRTEHDFMSAAPWRRRVIVPLQLPPLGWQVVTLGYVEGAQAVENPTSIRTNEDNSAIRIESGMFSLEPRVGGKSIEIRRGGVLWTTLRASVMADEWGSWGSMEEAPAGLHINTVLENWRVSECEILERGPLRAALWLRLQGESARSWLELTISVGEGSENVKVAARVLWNERAARLKLQCVLPCGGTEAEYEVPGGSARRGECGQAPGGRWARLEVADFGIASDALYDFDLAGSTLSATIVRATRYAAGDPKAGAEEKWRPALDAGELKFGFALAPYQSIMRVARELENPSVTQTVAAAPGDWPREATLLQLPPHWELLSLQREGDTLHAQVFARGEGEPLVQWRGREQRVAPIAPGRLGFLELSNDVLP